MTILGEDAMGRSQADQIRETLWATIEPLVQAAITQRLIEFEEALVARGQIAKTYPPEPPRATERPRP